MKDLPNAHLYKVGPGGKLQKQREKQTPAGPKGSYYNVNRKNLQRKYNLPKNLTEGSARIIPRRVIPPRVIPPKKSAVNLTIEKYNVFPLEHVPEARRMFDLCFPMNTDNRQFKRRSYKWYVMIQKGVLLGFVAVNSKGYFTHVCVKVRGKGYGSRLMKYFMDDWDGTLTATVLLADGEKLERFYEHLGFEEIRRTKNASTIQYDPSIHQ